jgi:hypothetical protein
MATLQSGNNPGPRIESGDHLLEVAATLGKARTKPVAARLAAFATEHAAYKKADAAVKKADGALRRAQGKVGEADVGQDGAVETLASALVGEGLPRVNPFKPFGLASPNVIKNKGYAAEAGDIQKLCAKVKAHKPALPGSNAAAAVAVKAAKAVLAALKPIERLLKARTTAISRRDALEQPWETAFAAVKRGARAAEDEGAAGLFDALFGVEKPGSGKKAKKATKAKAKVAKASAAKATDGAAAEKGAPASAAETKSAAGKPGADKPT